MAPCGMGTSEVCPASCSRTHSLPEAAWTKGGVLPACCSGWRLDACCCPFLVTAMLQHGQACGVAGSSTGLHMRMHARKALVGQRMLSVLTAWGSLLQHGMGMSRGVSCMRIERQPALLEAHGGQRLMLKVG